MTSPLRVWYFCLAMRCDSLPVCSWHFFYLLCSICAQQAFLTAIYTSPASKIGYTPTQDIPITFTGTVGPTVFAGTGSFTTATDTDSTDITFGTPRITYEPPEVTVVSPHPNANSVGGTPTLTFVQLHFLTAAIPLIEHFFRSTASTGEMATNTSTMIAVSQTAPSSGGRSNRTDPIVGGIVGGIGGLLAILITTWFCWYRSSRRAALAGNPYTNQEVRHARRTDLASSTEIISRGHLSAVGGAVPGPALSTPSGDTDVRQYPSSQVLLSDNALEEGRATPATSGLPPTPSSGKGISPAAPPHRAPLAEGRAASRQHGECGPASSLEGGGEGEDGAM
ncbi:hypothetical protein BC826DRAFT_79740 [Russula brevipes]|nr:hypothetical protein BC826DRAFT_79740 [Russula brevipes]